MNLFCVLVIVLDDDANFRVEPISVLPVALFQGKCYRWNEKLGYLLHFYV